MAHRPFPPESTLLLPGDVADRVEIRASYGPGPAGPRSGPPRGEGAFALEDLPGGIMLLPYGGYLYTPDDKAYAANKNRPYSMNCTLFDGRPRVLDPAVNRPGEGRVLDAHFLRMKLAAAYVNEPGPGETPNCKFLNTLTPVPPAGTALGAVEDPDGEPWPLAWLPTIWLLRPVAKGEELLVRYNYKGNMDRPYTARREEENRVVPLILSPPFPFSLGAWVVMSLGMSLFTLS